MWIFDRKAEISERSLRLWDGQGFGGGLGCGFGFGFGMLDGDGESGDLLSPSFWVQRDLYDQDCFSLFSFFAEFGRGDGDF